MKVNLNEKEVKILYEVKQKFQSLLRSLNKAEDLGLTVTFEYDENDGLLLGNIKASCEFNEEDLSAAVVNFNQGGSK